MGHGTTILRDCDWVVRSADDAVRDASVVVEDGRIAAVGTASELAGRTDESARVVDCRGLVVMPGLVNAHCHVYQILCRGLGKSLPTEDWLAELIYPVMRALDDDDCYAAATLACAEGFRTGTTAIVEQLTNFARFRADAEARAFRDCGMRAVVARAASTLSLIDPSETGEPEDEIDAVASFIERWADSDLVRPAAGPSGLYTCDPETLARLKRIASEAGTRFCIHLSETRNQLRIAEERGYQGQIDWADRLGLLDADTVIAHAVWLSEPEFETLAASGAVVVHNPCSNMVMGSGVAPVPRFLADGVTVALASDGPASNDSLDMVAEMKAAALLHRVAAVDPEAIGSRAVFRMATESGARALGLEGRLGRIDAGLEADLVAVRASDSPSLQPMYEPVDTLVFAGSGRDVELTMVAGRIVYERSRYETLDLEGALGHIAESTVPKIEAVLR